MARAIQTDKYTHLIFTHACIIFNIVNIICLQKMGVLEKSLLAFVIAWMLW